MARRLGVFPQAGPRLLTVFSLDFTQHARPILRSSHIRLSVWMHFFQKAHPEMCSQGLAAAAADTQTLGVSCLLPTILSSFYHDSELYRAGSPLRRKCFAQSCRSAKPNLLKIIQLLQQLC